MVEDTSTYKRKWIILLAVGMGAFLATIDGGIINIGLNTLVKEFGRPLVVIEWVVLAYMLTVSSLMLSIGRLGDMLARKKTLPCRYHYLHHRICPVRAFPHHLLADRIPRPPGSWVVYPDGAGHRHGHGSFSH